MRTIRVHHSGPLSPGHTLRLDDRTGLHLTRVLRLKSGADIVVFDGIGHEHDGTLIADRGGDLGIVVGGARNAVPPSPLSITLAQGVSRGERMDYAIQKATELGVAAVTPLLCERSVVKLDADQAARKRAHWLGVAIAAAEQSGRADVPHVADAESLEAHLAKLQGRGDDVLRLVLDPAATTGLRQLPSTFTSVELLIGPEGGLSEREIDLARRVGYCSLRLGPRVLRTETAAAAAIAVLQALYGDLG
jgi:16S rRNA (uracil1498-N3)-methyltransferase